MLITCPSCGHRFDAESVIIRRGYFPVRCSKCHSRFDVNFRTGEVRARGDAPQAQPTEAPAASPSAPPEAPAADGPSGDASAAPPPSNRDPELERFVADVRANYDDLRNQDPFELLGVRVESSNQDVMQAYFQTAERFRATRWEKDLTEEERAMLWDLTVRVDSAFNELGDLERRRRAHRIRAQATQRMDAQTVEIKGGAEAEYVKGYQAFQDGRFTQARDHFGRCVELDPNRSSYHFRVGQSILRMSEDGQDADWETAKSSFERALELDPENLEYLLSLGKLWKARGNLSLAMPYFKRVRDLDPGHIEANREIQAYLTQKRNAPESRSTTARLFRMLKRK